MSLHSRRPPARDLRPGRNTSTPWRHWAVALALAASSTVQAAAPELEAAAHALATEAGRDAASLQALYAAPRTDPVWLTPDAQPTPIATQALQRLASAADDGLNPADYAVPAWTDAGATPAQRSVALSLAVLRYATDLRRGRVDPRQLDFRWTDPPVAFDAAAWLDAAAQQGDLPGAIAGLPPAVAPYAALRQMLARYRALAAREPLTWPQAPAKLQPDEHWEGIPTLRQHLTAVGDLVEPLPTPPDPQRYSPELVAAVQAFQRRHGLEADGVIGKGTLAALRVPLAQRVHQIAWSMERLRWLPDLPDPRGLAINLPTFRLRAWEGPANQATATLGMGVIVGRALDTRTPVMLADMRHVIFRPYWNIPRSILLKEVLPAWARDPAYLDKHDMEIVRGPGDDARVLGTAGAHLAGLRDGSLRIRQRPGPKNALGLVKFVFPNDSAIYLHGTPAQQLFQRARRDFSHGCVRVEDPVALAQWLLRDVAGWDRTRIEAAMATGNNQRVELARPLPVLLYYLTAIVNPDDGRLHLADDLYGHDARLAQALQQRSAGLARHQ